MGESLLIDDASSVFFFFHLTIKCSLLIDILLIRQIHFSMFCFLFQALNLILLTSSELSELRYLQAIIGQSCWERLVCFFVFFMVPFTDGNYKSLPVGSGKF